MTWIEYLSQGWVGAIIGIVGLVLALISIWLAIHFYRRSRQGAQIAYHYWSTRVLGGRGHTLPEAVKITYKDQPIENLCRSLVMIWNISDKTIYGKNIVEDDRLRIDLGKGANILDARMVEVTRDVNKWRFGPVLQFAGGLGSPEVTYSEVTIEFDYLDSGDGCVVEIFHTDSGEPPVLRGVIREMPRGFKNYKQKFPFSGPSRYVIPIAALIAFSLLSAAIYGILSGDTGNVVSFLFFALLFGVASIPALIINHRRYPKALSMPEFTSR